MASDPGDDKLTLVSLREGAYEILRKRILNHDYPPGFRLDLATLEAQLGVSRTPLKEALHRLEVEGLVEIRPRRGTFVAEIDPTEVAETFDVRRVLELYAVELAVQQASSAEIAELRARIADMRRLRKTDDFQSFIDQYILLDHEFHRFIVNLAHNKRLAEIHQQIDVHVQIARLRQKFTKADLESTEAEHEAILQAFERRDVQALLKALNEHIERSKARTLKAFADHD